MSWPPPGLLWEQYIPHPAHEQAKHLRGHVHVRHDDNGGGAPLLWVFVYAPQPDYHSITDQICLYTSSAGKPYDVGACRRVAERCAFVLMKMYGRMSNKRIRPALLKVLGMEGQ